MSGADLDAAIQNLLLNCAGAEAGETLLIVHESPALGWYDVDAPKAVAEMASQLELRTTMLEVGAPGDERDPALLDATTAHDRTIFFARVGDQDRFEKTGHKNPSVMCYARDATGLASAYGRVDHRAMLALKAAINGIVLSASHIEITCPLGTHYQGSPGGMDEDGGGDVGVKRFPMGVPQPIVSDGFNGRVALGRYLTPTGSKAYDPPHVAIDGNVFAHLDGHRIVDFTGEAALVTTIRQHYEHVAGLFEIEPFIAHSWHAGIHPGCRYSDTVEANPDRWSNNVFTHPRLLHFHTCGNYAPGEICWTILDPTVVVDGTALWEDGVLHPTRFEPGQHCFAEWPELDDLFAAPVTPIGIA